MLRLEQASSKQAAAIDTELIPQYRPAPTRSVPTLTDILHQLGTLRPLYTTPALIGICEDGLPLLIDLAKPSGLLIELSRPDAARLLFTLFKSAHYWTDNLSYQIVRREVDFPDQPAGIILVPNQLDFFPDTPKEKQHSLTRCLEERSAFVIFLAVYSPVLSGFDLHIGIDAWGKWFAFDQPKRKAYDFVLPDMEGYFLNRENP